MTHYKIEGMTCNGCRTRVENKLKELDVNARVDLETQEAQVSDAVEASQVIEAVASTGYKVVQ